MQNKHVMNPVFRSDPVVVGNERHVDLTFRHPELGQVGVLMNEESLAQLGHVLDEAIGRRTGPGEGAEAALKRISDAAQSTAAREAQP